VTFNATNTGLLPHELKIFPANPDPLPTTSKGDVDETQVQPVGAVAVLAPGRSAQKTISGLAPGTYYLVCNLPGHYAAGMSTVFKVN
jgi:uncharacterized cupredoxin-like copper-binding protein